MVKPSIIPVIVQDLNKSESITMMEFGCGNGSNSRVIAKAIFDWINPNIKITTIYIDVSSRLLNEAMIRSQFFQEKYINFSYELVQMNCLNHNSLNKFARQYKNCADFIFSIKFFHNTNVKITSNIAKSLNLICKDDGVFLIQYCCIDDAKQYTYSLIKNLMNRPYGNSTLIDRYIADTNLKRNGFELIYKLTQKNVNKKKLKINHFQNYSKEFYYKKIT